MAKGPALALGQLTFPISRLATTVGRKDRLTGLAPDVDLTGVDAEKGVSRKHAELTWAEGRISVRDTGSTNGTAVNGETLPLQVARPLDDGDRVSFGGLELTFVAEAEWPEGLVADWPEPAPEPEAEAEPEPDPYLAEETMIHPPAAAAEVEVASEAAEVEVGAAESPAGEVTPEVPAWVPPTVQAPAVESASVAWTPCSNHPHLPAIGLCPGCLEPFCQDCLPDRGDAPMACNRCFGIQQRLGLGAPGFASPYPAPAPAAPPQAAWPQPAEAEKKKGLFGR